MDQIRKVLIEEIPPERLALSRGTFHGNTLDGPLCFIADPAPLLIDGLPADAAPQCGLLDSEAAPERAGELRAQHDLARPELEEDVEEDVPGQRRPVPL